jgi:hypothetical protein
MMNILTPEKFSDFERYIKTEAIMNNTLQAVNRMGGGRTNSQEMRTLLYALFDYKLAGLRLLGQWANGALGDRYARMMTHKFGSGSVQDFNDVYTMLANNPRNQNSFAKFINGTAMKMAQLGGTAVGSEMPEGRAFGGAISPRKRPAQASIPQLANKLEQAAATPTMAAKGGVIDRPKRATGGRIPEVDKMFKQAKKYVDSHTKGILDVPDDVVAKALHIAKNKI